MECHEAFLFAIRYSRIHAYQLDHFVNCVIPQMWIQIRYHFFFEVRNSGINNRLLHRCLPESIGDWVILTYKTTNFFGAKIARPIPIIGDIFLIIDRTKKKYARRLLLIVCFKSWLHNSDIRRYIQFIHLLASPFTYHGKTLAKQWQSGGKYFWIVIR